MVPPEEDEDSDSKYGSGRSRYMALKERRNRLARSRSSHNFGDDDEDEPVSPTTQSPSAYLAARWAFFFPYTILITHNRFNSLVHCKYFMFNNG